MTISPPSPRETPVARAKGRHGKKHGPATPRAAKVRLATKSQGVSVRSGEEKRHIGELLAAVRKDPRAHIYGISALAAAAQGVTRKELRGLSAIGRHLQVATATRKRIDAVCRRLPARSSGLKALFEAIAQEKARPAVGVEPNSIEQVRNQAEEHILELPMLDASELSTLLGSRSSNKRQYAAKLHERGEVMGLRRGNRFMYPAFQLDHKRGRVHPEIAEVGKILDAKADPWGVIGWWVSPHPRLSHGRAPADLLGTPDARALLLLARSTAGDVG